MDKSSILITITVVDINHWCCWNHPLYSMIDFPLPLCAILTRLQLLLRRWFKILFERRYFATFFLLWIFDKKNMMEILPLKFTVTELKTTHSEKMYFFIAHLTCAVHKPTFKFHKKLSKINCDKIKFMESPFMTHYLALDFLSSADQECSRKLNISLLIVLVHILFIRMHCNAPTFAKWQHWFDKGRPWAQRLIKMSPREHNHLRCTNVIHRRINLPWNRTKKTYRPFYVLPGWSWKQIKKLIRYIFRCQLVRYLWRCLSSSEWALNCSPRVLVNWS